MAHAHPTPNLQMQRILPPNNLLLLRIPVVGRDIPHLRQNIRQPHRSIMIHHADPSDRRYRPVEQQLPMLKVNVPVERTLQHLHQRKRRRHDHLQNVVRRVAQKFSRRCFQIQDPPQEGGRRDEQFGHVFAAGAGSQE